MNDSKRKTPPTKLKPLADYQYDLYLRDERFVYISDDDEHYVGLLVGYSFARGSEAGGYIFDDYPTKNGEGLQEWTAMAGKSLYRMVDRYNELLGYLNGEHDDDAGTPGA